MTKKTEKSKKDEGTSGRDDVAILLKPVEEDVGTSCEATFIKMEHFMYSTAKNGKYAPTPCQTADE